MEQPEQIVSRIVEDLRDRKGLGDEWNSLSPEDQQDIIEKWVSITRFVLSD